MKLHDVRNNQWIVLFMFGMKMEWKKMYVTFPGAEYIWYIFP